MRTRSRRGIALAAALGAIVLIGTLIAGAFFAANQEYRIGRNTLVQSRGLTSAEFGQNKLYSKWDQSWNTAMTNGQVMVRVDSIDGVPVDTVRLTRLSNLTFLATSDGWTGTKVQDDARKRTEMLLRLNLATYPMVGALVTRGQTKIGGSAVINGIDTTMAGWEECPPAGASVAGVVTDSISKLVYAGCSNYTCLQGSPLFQIAPVASDTNTYFKFGNVDWTALKTMADKRVTGTITGAQPSYNADGTCKTTDINNWGDPTHTINPAAPGKCEWYFPIIYAPGDLSVNGNKGQGMLIVEGNLDVQGGFEFAGTVIVRGRLKTTGTGGKFTGSVMAADVQVGTGLDANQVGGNATFRFSRCAITQSLKASARPARVAERSWADGY